jgi:uncharacterized membrane protein
VIRVMVSILGKSSRINVKILVAIVGFALLVKLVIFILSVKTSISFSLPNAENWQDFSLAYVRDVNAFKSGLLPYRDFYFPYPPLFLYVLTLFSYLPANPWSMAIPLVIADALTVIPVYLIAREFVDEKYSMMISILFVLAPTCLYYVDYLFLNPSLTTLFLMLSIYFLIKKRYDFSAIALALSIGFKQTALVAVPVFLFVMWRRKGTIPTLRYLTLIATISFAISLPFIIVSPSLYLATIFHAPQGFWSQVPAGYFFISSPPYSFEANGPVTLFIPIFMFFLPKGDLQAYANPAGFFLIVILIGAYALFLYKTAKNTEINERDSLRYALYALMILFTFFTSYKYYIAGAIPIFALIVRSKKDALGFIAFNLVLMFVPRYLSSWILLIALIWLIRPRNQKENFTAEFFAQIESKDTI